MTQWYRKVLAAMLCIAAVYGTDAMAETTSNELSAISKIISLSRDIPAGNVDFGVVYDPDSAVSKADMEALKALIGGGYSAPKHTFKFKEIMPGDVTTASAPIVFLTEGLTENVQKEALSNAAENKKLTITTTLSYVEAGTCVVGVDVADAVTIVMNGDAYDASGLKFDTAFEFMVKEI